MRPREANRTKVTTRNVDRIRIDGSGPLSLDGQEFPQASASSPRRTAHGRRPALSRGCGNGTRLQGPVDDAFMESFLCVRPTGERDRGHALLARGIWITSKRIFPSGCEATRV